MTMVRMDWDPDYVPMVKLGLHCSQIVLAFVAWCLELVVFSGKHSKIVGTNGWTFGVCFLSVPAWIYLVMTPRFARTRKFAQPHAMLAVDAVFCILWLSAFATQAAYNSKNQCGSQCNLSKAIVGLGVFVMLLFGGTTFLSAYTLTYYNFHNTLPGYDNRKIRGGTNDIDPDKAAFSMAPHDDEAYERVHMGEHEHDANGGGDGSYSSAYGHANPYSAGDMRHDNDHHDADTDDFDRYGALPPRVSTPLYDMQSGYGSGPAGMPYAPPPGGSYGDEPAKFPHAPYDRVTR